MLGVTSFTVSAILIVGLFFLRYVEGGRGSRFFPNARKSLDRFALLVVRFVAEDIPRFLVRSFKHILIYITDFFSSLLLKIVRFIEGHLHIVVHRVRGKKDDLAKSEPTSNHLTDMQNHKEAVSKTIEELEEVQ